MPADSLLCFIIIFNFILALLNFIGSHFKRLSIKRFFYTKRHITVTVMQMKSDTNNCNVPIERSDSRQKHSSLISLHFANNLPPYTSLQAREFDPYGLDNKDKTAAM